MKRMHVGGAAIVMGAAALLVACSGDDGVVPVMDGGTDTGGAVADSGLPGPDAGGDDGGVELVECDLREADPCGPDRECVYYVEYPEEWWRTPEAVDTTHVCRTGFPIGEGLPCALSRLPERDGLIREIDSCEEGSRCTDFGGVTPGGPTCHRLCGPGIGDCDPSSHCGYTHGEAIGDQRGLCWPDTVAIGCDAVLQTGCASGEVCFLIPDAFDSARGSGRCYPRAGLPLPYYDFAVRLDADCRDIECTYGQACVEDGAEWTCRRVCDRTGMGVPGDVAPEDGIPWGDCPAGESCNALHADYVTPAGYCH